MEFDVRVQARLRPVSRLDRRQAFVKVTDYSHSFDYLANLFTVFIHEPTFVSLCYIRSAVFKRTRVVKGPTVDDNIAGFVYERTSTRFLLIVLPKTLLPSKLIK